MLRSAASLLARSSHFLSVDCQLIMIIIISKLKLINRLVWPVKKTIICKIWITTILTMSQSENLMKILFSVLHRTIQWSLLMGHQTKVLNFHLLLKLPLKFKGHKICKTIPEWVRISFIKKIKKIHQFKNWTTKNTKMRSTTNTSTGRLSSAINSNNHSPPRPQIKF